MNSFSLYLAKDDVASLEEVLTENAQTLIDTSMGVKVVADDFADENALFVFPGNEDVPKWLKALRSVYTVADEPKTRTSCGVLVFKKNDRYFAISFSYGHMFLDDAKIEADFGLKVAINTLNDKRVRSVERSNLGVAIRDLAQAAGQRELREFGFDEALDLIRKVSGNVTGNAFADSVTGAQSLRITKNIELSDIPDIAVEALRLFNETTYQETNFKVIDFLSPVLDVNLKKRLDAELVNDIKQEGTEFEIAIPAILSTEAAYYRFERAGFNSFYADLSLTLYKENLGDELDGLTLDTLKHHRIVAYSEATDKGIESWPVRSALVGTIVVEGERFVLNEGAWYRIDQVYKRKADEILQRLQKEPDPVFIPLRRIIKGTGAKRKLSYQSEETYNEEIAEASDYLNLDQKLIQIADEPGRGIEACDLLDIDGRRFIHVKKSSRSSSVLSHFFKQGGNAAQMVRKYAPFREALIDKVRKLYGDQKADQLIDSLNEKWTVEFLIADAPRHNGEFDIPFFSKLTLSDQAEDMEAMQYNVAVRFIQLPAPA